MMLHFLRVALFLTATVFFIRCAEPGGEKIPDTVLPKEKMVDVLTDLSLMEAAILSKNYQPAASNVPDTAFKFNIYKQHNISRAIYDSSIAFYAKHPKLFKEVYDQVLDKLGKMK